MNHHDDLDAETSKVQYCLLNRSMDWHIIPKKIVRDSRASQLQSCRQRIALFKGLQVENYEDRATALEKIIQVVKSYIRSSLSPASSTTSPTLSDPAPGLTATAAQEDSDTTVSHTTSAENEEDEYSKQLFYYLLTIKRLSISCPYADVRQTFKDLLLGLKVSCRKKHFLCVKNKPKLTEWQHSLGNNNDFNATSKI